MIIKRLLEAGVTRTGNRVCEDALCIHENIYGVFDGATAATKDEPFVAQRGMTDAHWIANTASILLPFYTHGAALKDIMPSMNGLLSRKFHAASRSKTPDLRTDWLDATKCPAIDAGTQPISE